MGKGGEFVEDPLVDFLTMTKASAREEGGQELRGGGGTGEKSYGERMWAQLLEGEEETARHDAAFRGLDGRGDGDDNRLERRGVITRNLDILVVEAVISVGGMNMPSVSRQ